MFDAEFSALSNVAFVQAQIKHDSSLFDIVFMNVRNDMKNLSVCRKELRQSIKKGKKLYVQCSLAYTNLQNLMSEL